MPLLPTACSVVFVLLYMHNFALCWYLLLVYGAELDNNKQTASSCSVWQVLMDMIG